MNDLRTWTNLDPTVQRDAGIDGDLLRDLEDLSSRSITERMPLFSRAARLLQSRDPKAKAASLKFLTGAKGWIAARDIAACLNDSDSDVQQAAAKALVASADGNPGLLALGLFHHSSDVQQFVIDALGSANNVADPRVAVLLIQLLGNADHRDKIVSLTRDAYLDALPWNTLRSFYSQKTIEPAYARRLVSRSHIKQLVYEAAVECTDTEDVVQAVRDNRLFATSNLVWAMRLFWLPPEKEETETHKRFFEQFVESMADYAVSSSVLSRFVDLLAWLAEALGCWNLNLVETMVENRPQTLLDSRIPIDLRRLSIDALYRRGTGCKKADAILVRQILENEICRRPSGLLDLRAIGGVLFLHPSSAYSMLANVHPIPRIVASFWEDPDSSARLFAVPCENHERLILLEKVTENRKRQLGMAYCVLLHFVPANQQDFLDDLTPDAALDLLGHLMRFHTSGDMELSVNRRRAACESLCERIGESRIGDFLTLWLADADPRHQPVCLELLANFTLKFLSREFVAEARKLAINELEKLVAAIPYAAGVRYDVEVSLAIAIADRESEKILTWCAPRIPSTKLETLPPPVETSVATDISASLAQQLITCSDEELESLLAPCLEHPMRGVADALLKRPQPCVSKNACLALLGARDEITQVDAAFDAFCSNSSEFLRELDVDAVACWRGEPELSLIGNAWLYRWEQNAFAFADQALVSSSVMIGCLTSANQFKSELLGWHIWKASRLVFDLFCARHRPSAEKLVDEHMIKFLVSNLTSQFSNVAATLLVNLHNRDFTPELMQQFRTEVAELGPLLSQEDRQTLKPWVDSTGIGPPVARRATRTETKSKLVDQISRSTDLDQLATWCRSGNPNIVSDAALRLLELGGNATRRILDVLHEHPLVPCAAMLADTISLWPDEVQIDAASVVDAGGVDSQIRFLLSIGLAELGESSFATRAMEILCEPAKRSWLLPNDLKRLKRLVEVDDQVIVSLMGCEHPVAYFWATQAALQISPHSASAFVTQAVRSFVLLDQKRPPELRLRIANWLFRRGDMLGFPLLLRSRLSDESEASEVIVPLPDALAEETVENALMAGPSVFNEGLLLDLMHGPGSKGKYQGALARLMRDGVKKQARYVAASRMAPSSSQSHDLRRIAETFAWGIPLSRELTGRVFAVQMIGDEALGYTRMNEDRIYISPMPMLRGARHGREIVEGLILHELGHHMYHGGKDNQDIWNEAQCEKLHGLLNLVADEHLERNLRAMDNEYGDRLKRLGAFAFQHNRRSFDIFDLLRTLGSNVVPVLSNASMQPCREKDHITIDSGGFLQELERSGSSFARFFRALRMGLGNRYDDPKVGEALKLFNRGFRHLKMPDLMQIVYQLRDIFADDHRLLDCVNEDGLQAGDDPLSAGSTMTDAQIQSEILRITSRKKGNGFGSGSGKGVRCINVTGELEFERMHNVVRVPYVAARHAELAGTVQREARQFRRFLDHLGVRYAPSRRRLQGRRFDRGSTQSLVLRGDPRILIAREPQNITDLFLGVLIDCSGSMEYQNNIHKAKLFAAMLAEAVRGHRGIDLRLFGFTHDTIFDAGDASRPGISNLKADGGNNDAGALAHAAAVAAASQRRAKLLVMISDGLPTECSVEALRGLVNHLTRRKHLLCAQVAVEPLEEICFPHYIELGKQDDIASVRKFGGIVASLVRNAMGK